MRPWIYAACCAAIAAVAVSAAAQTKPAAKTAAQPTFTQSFRNFVAQAQQRLAQTGAPTTAPPARDGSQAVVVDWPAASAAQKSRFSERGRAVNAKFLAANKPAIDTLRIPVLLPSDPDLAAGLRLYPDGDFYTVASNPPGMGFTLMGAGRVYPLGAGTIRGLGPGGLAARIPPDGIIIRLPTKAALEDGDGLNASFNRFGALYTISLDCDDPLHDPRCTGETYVRGVIARLLVVNPAGKG